jgi:hypothetical protein
VENKSSSEKELKKKGVFRKFFEKMDKKMKEMANASPCCCKPKDKDNNSCCS